MRWTFKREFHLSQPLALQIWDREDCEGLTAHIQTSVRHSVAVQVPAHACPHCLSTNLNALLEPIAEKPLVTLCFRFLP